MQKFLKGIKVVEKNGIIIKCDKLLPIRDCDKYCDVVIGFCPVFELGVSAYICKNRIECRKCDGKVG